MQELSKMAGSMMTWGHVVSLLFLLMQINNLHNKYDKWYINSSCSPLVSRIKIWIFFPIPVFCLIMLSLPSYRSIERAGTNLVGKIFFTRVSVGPLHISLYSVFIFASFIIFTVAFKSISHGFGSAHVPCSG